MLETYYSFGRHKCETGIVDKAISMWKNITENWWRQVLAGWFVCFWGATTCFAHDQENKENGRETHVELIIKSYHELRKYQEREREKKEKQTFSEKLK